MRNLVITTKRTIIIRCDMSESHHNELKESNPTCIADIQEFMDLHGIKYETFGPVDDNVPCDSIEF